MGRYNNLTRCNDYSEPTNVVKPCIPSMCKNRLYTNCMFCIESDARNGRFEQMKAKLSVVHESEKQMVIDWIEHCRVSTQKEADNLAKAMYEIGKV